VKAATPVDCSAFAVQTWSVANKEAPVTVAELIDALSQYPPHFRVSLCQVISVGGGAGFDEVLDSPIIGVAGHPAGDVRLVTTRDGTISSLGPLRRFRSDPSPG